MNIIRHAIWLLTLCLCGCGLAMAGSVSYTLTPDLSTFSLTDVKGGDGNDYTRIVWPDTYASTSTSDKGTPELPLHECFFLVPTLSTDFSVEIIGNGKQEFNLNYSLYPVQEPIPLLLGSQSVSFISPKENSYGINENNLKAEVINERIMGGRYHMVKVKVSLATYDGGSSVLTLFTGIEVTLNYRKCTMSEMGIGIDLSKPLNDQFPIETLVVNPNDVSYMVTDPDSGMLRVASSKSKDHYLIVAPRDMCPAFSELILWKQQKGLTVSITPIEEVYLQYAPKSIDTIPDKAASLRTFLHEYKKSCNGGELYVLLAGNPAVTDMPIRYQFDYSEFAYSQYWDMPLNTRHFVPSDNYFLNVSAQWPIVFNPANNCYVDLYLSKWEQPEIFVGRLLSVNNQDILNYTKKLILYESNPGRGDRDYLKNAFAFEQDALHTSLIDSSTSILNLLSRNRFDVLRFQDKRRADPPQNWPQGSDVISQMRNSGFISWHGHGNPAYIGTSAGIHPGDAKSDDFSLWYGLAALESYSATDRYGGGDVFTKRLGEGLDNLNNSQNPSVLYSISCTNAPLDFYNDREEKKIPILYFVFRIT